MIEVLPPVLVLLTAAILIGLTRGHLRSAIVLISPLITLWVVWQVPDGVSMTVDFIGYQLEPVEGSALRRLFAIIFSLMTFAGGLFAFRHASALELAASYAYAACAIGVAFAGDLITLFIFWEAMAIRKENFYDD